MIRAVIVTYNSAYQLARKFVYRTIKAPFHNYNFLFLQQLLYSYHRIPNRKHADSTLFWTQVYPCNCSPDLCSSSFPSQSYINSLQVCIYNSLVCQMDVWVNFAQSSVVKKGALLLNKGYHTLICTDSTLTFKTLTQRLQLYNGAWLSLATSLSFPQCI